MSLHLVSLKKNIIAGYASQIYVTLTAIITLPLYIQYMGAEAYGLVGFFAMLQASFSLLDLGLTPTIARETARFRAGSHDVMSYRRLFRALNLIFLLVATIGGGALFVTSEAISQHWLNVQKLALSEVLFALQVMAISVALRWMTGLYRGVVSGSERLVWLAGFNAVIATLRFLVVFPVLWHFGATPTVFFTYQLLVAVVEYAGLRYKSITLLPVLSASQQAELGWSFKPVKSILKFSLSIALTSGIWVFVTQTDKFLMSKILTLEEYGYFTLAVLVSSGVMMISSPISSAIMPRLVKLDAEQKNEEFIETYRNSTQIIVIISGTLSVVMAFFSELILYVWTGDAYIAKVTAPVMALYAAGYGILVVGALPYYLQYAKGNLKLHIIGSMLYVSILIPVLFVATNKYGMLGAGYSWLFINFIYFFTWTYYVHHVYIKNKHLKWLFVDIFLIIVPAFFVAVFLKNMGFASKDRIDGFVYMVFVTIVVLFVSMLFSRFIQVGFFKIIKHD